MRLCYISIKGQWLNDLRSGEGTLRHQSGLLYEGMWTSDQPVEITTGMEIRVLPAELHPGERFIVEVECLTDRGIAFHGQLELPVVIFLSNVIKCYSETLRTCFASCQNIGECCIML